MRLINPRYFCFLYIYLYFFKGGGLVLVMIISIYSILKILCAYIYSMFSLILFQQFLLIEDSLNNQHSFSFWKFRTIWVWLDSASYILLIAAFFVRHFYNDDTFSVARQLYALSLLFMYFRCLKYLRLHKKMGMMVIMMLKMVTRLLSFNIYFTDKIMITLSLAST